MGPFTFFLRAKYFWGSIMKCVLEAEYQDYFWNSTKSLLGSDSQFRQERTESQNSQSSPICALLLLPRDYQPHLCFVAATSWLSRNKEGRGRRLSVCIIWACIHPRPTVGRKKGSITWVAFCGSIRTYTYPYCRYCLTYNYTFCRTKMPLCGHMTEEYGSQNWF